MDGEGGVGFEFFVQDEFDFGVGYCGDLSPVEEAFGDDIEVLAGLGAQDAGEVGGLPTGEGGVSGAAGLRRPGVGDEAAAHKAVVSG
jgi:hypothetical protein